MFLQTRTAIAIASIAMGAFSPLGHGQLAITAPSFTAVPFEFDPGKTNLVKAGWLTGIGCPQNVLLATTPPTNLTDPACTTADASDRKVEGLLLVKTGPTANNASAGADLKGVKGTVLMELGYDIRKPLLPIDPRGSHCGAGAPRFNIEIGGQIFFIGCNSPPATVIVTGNGWIRLRWTSPLMAFGPNGLTLITGRIAESISIVFDEGQDIGLDNFGAAVLDNIDVNGVLVGRGPTGGSK